MRRQLIATFAALAGALLLATLGLDALRWENRIAADDARFAAAPEREGLWAEAGRLPSGLARRILGLDDDLAYRDAVSLYVRSHPGEPTTLHPRREALRGEAQRALTAVSREGGDVRRRSFAAMLSALLILGRGDLFTSAEDRVQTLRTAIGALQVALALDPGNAEAKRNLELALGSAGLPVSGATDPGGTTDTGDTAGVGRTGSGY